MTETADKVFRIVNQDLRVLLDKDRTGKYKDDLVIHNAYMKACKIISDIMQDKFRGRFFKYGNLKLDINIARFTLPEVITCGQNCSGCYAKKMGYKSVKIFRLSNLIIALFAIYDNEFKEKLLKVINKELNKHRDKCRSINKVPIFRFHDSGDIFSDYYLKFMIDIVLQNPDIKFYAYTKRQEAYKEYLSVKETLGFKNFNIVNSIVEESFYNYFDFIHNFKYEFKKFKDMIRLLKSKGKKVFVCNYNLDRLFKENRFGYKMLLGYMLSNKDVISFADGHSVCGTCIACCDYEYTVFIKH